MIEAHREREREKERESERERRREREREREIKLLEKCVFLKEEYGVSFSKRDVQIFADL